MPSEDTLPKDVEELFTHPPGVDSALTAIDLALSSDVYGYLKTYLNHAWQATSVVEVDFQDHQIPTVGANPDNYINQCMDSTVANAVDTASPYYIGHMTSALPQFLLPLAKLVSALNQNVVKMETSGAFTVLEQQVLAMMHQLVFADTEKFYGQWIHNTRGALGGFCSGGTVANITALWVARNQAFPAEEKFRGVEIEGTHKALAHYYYKDAVVLVSERGHYSLSKAIDLLGLGREALVTIEVDKNHRIQLDQLEKKCIELTERSVKIIAIVGVAGSTETGSVDPLEEMAVIAERYQAHFHVDAAWGGASLFSSKGRQLLKGIDKADTVTIDAHKQLYSPMGSGMVLYKDPRAVASISHHANYILRKGSRDLGQHSLEGSRPGIALMLHACLHVLGKRGYKQLIDHSLAKATHFASLINKHPDFELTTSPQLCLLTYRFVPRDVAVYLDQLSDKQRFLVNEKLNELTISIQVLQKRLGNSFVSRTSLKLDAYDRQDICVFRVVLANPLTTYSMLQEILDEQAVVASTFDQQLRHIYAELMMDDRKAG